MLIDKFGRQITYLRLAVTDRCNMRCFYCMPACGNNFVPRSELLSYEEMLRLANIFAGAGINKIRLTGGEPFVRKDFMQFLEELNKISGIESLNLTTNGVLTTPHIPRLKELGISVNLSLDSLRPEVNAKITRTEDLEKVLTCLNSLIQHQVPTKINTVVMNGINHDDIIPLALLTEKNDIDVRFLEEMPFNGQNRKVNPTWDHKKIESVLLNGFKDIAKLPPDQSLTSQRYQVNGFKGKLGIIASYSRTFCGSCNRIRVTATGNIRTCLYANEQGSIRDVLRTTQRDDKVLKFIQETVSLKAKNGFLSERKRGHKVNESMATVGG